MTVRFRHLSRLVGLAAFAMVFSGQAVSAEWPEIREAKKIAEEGFIYGLPIVTNYGTMYEFAIDRSSGQFKAPFNQILNETRLMTYTNPLSI